MYQFLKKNKKTTKKLVVSHLHGGLGNQLFQYAAAFSLADYIGASVVIDKDALHNLKNRPYKLDRLNIKQDFVNDNNKSITSPKILFRSLSSSLKLNRNSIIFHEPHYHFSESFFQLSGDFIELFGYFQSEKYFSRVESAIRKMFTFKDGPDTGSLYWMNRIKTEKISVSVHVRRGDYLLKPETHPTLRMGYYQRAMNLMKKCFGSELTFFIFSDDTEYVNHEFSNIRNVCIVPSDEGSDVHELIMMSQCHHNIIANSSFSWWGAWLNTNKEKIVVAPACWFGPKKMSQRNIMDLYPDNWIQLK